MWDDLRQRLRAFFKRETIERELDDELRFHLERQIERCMQAGHDRTDALRLARLDFGGLEQVKEEYRDSLGVRAITNLRRDFGLGARALRRQPGFSAIAVLTLALGVGATTAVFAVVDAVLIRPLPYPESDRIVVIEHHAPGLNVPDMKNSSGTLALYQREAHTLRAVALVDTALRNLTGAGVPARVRTADVSPEFFDVMGVRPFFGRRFVHGDGTPGAPSLAILSYGAWQSRFDGTHDIVGRTVHVDGMGTEIVGVMPKGFAYPDANTELLLAKAVDPNGAFGTFGLQGLARLAPGVTLESARREIAILQPRIAELSPDMPRWFLEKAGWSVTVEPLRDSEVSDARAALWIVFGAVAFLLLIACANVANLFLVRAEGRQRELAVRAALGSSRGRLAWSFLSETLLLGVTGGAAGTAIAVIAVRALVAAAPAELPRVAEIAVDGRVLLFAATVSVLAGVVFGLLPLPGHLRGSFGVLREGRLETGTRERHRVRHLLIGAQVALALVLLAGSGLMLRSFARLRAVEPGFDPTGVQTVGISLGRVQDHAAAAKFYERVLDEVRALPGVVSVGATNALPSQPVGVNGSSLSIRSRPTAKGDLPPVSMFVVTTPGFFETLRIPVREGRVMRAADTMPAAPARVWVNEAFVRQFMNGLDPLKEQIRFGQSPDLQIVGVVGNVHTFGLQEAIRPMAYLPPNTPVTGVDLGLLTLVLRTQANRATPIPDIRGVVSRINPEVPLTISRSMDLVLMDSWQRMSFTMTVLGVISLVALLLGAIGLYGVISYLVSQRTREIGVRMALGATPGRVRAMVLRQALPVVIPSMGVGLAAALALTRLMQSVLFEVNPTDPLTLAGVVAVLSVVCTIALYLPACRASGITPVEALKH